MKNNKYKILVLSDLNETASKTLESSIRLAEILDADINFFYVKKPTEVVKVDSQLSAMRTINKEYLSIDKEIKKIIFSFSENTNVNIDHTFTFGNVKNEIGKYIDENKPDIIVLGKRKSKIINFIGDNITQFILKKHKGTIVIAHSKNTLERNKELSLGLFNNVKPTHNFAESIISSSKNPFASFKIAEISNTATEKKITAKKKHEYVFENGDNSLKNISSYLSKKNINLLFVDRENTNAIDPNIKDIINNLDCSLILTT